MTTTRLAAGVVPKPRDRAHEPAHVRDPHGGGGKAFFEIAYGLRAQGPNESLGLVYSRLSNPDLEILEDRLTLWDDAEACAVFESGMAAIARPSASSTP